MGIGCGAFVEPLAAAGGGAGVCMPVAGASLVDCDRVIRPTIIRQFNRRWRKLVDGERAFLGLFYKYNTRLDNAFWRARAAADVAPPPLLSGYWRIRCIAIYSCLK